MSVRELTSGAVAEDPGDQWGHSSRQPARVIERVQAHYEVLALPHGKVYAWRSGVVVLKCGCGERLVCCGSTTRCRCGADYGDIVQELANPRPEGERLPWRADYHDWLEEKAALPCEYYDWLELRAIE